MKKTILIVDDDEELCEELSEVLRANRYSVNTAFDGFSAQKLIKENVYDLIILDLKIPGIEGLEILKSAKEKKIKAKIVILTGALILKEPEELAEAARGGKDERERLLKLADDIISKPFAVDAVLSKIKELINR